MGIYGTKIDKDLILAQKASDDSGLWKEGEMVDIFSQIEQEFFLNGQGRVSGYAAFKALYIKQDAEWPEDDGSLDWYDMTHRYGIDYFEQDNPFEIVSYDMDKFQEKLGHIQVYNLPSFSEYVALIDEEAKLKLQNENSGIRLNHNATKWAEIPIYGDAVIVNYKALEFHA